MEHGVPRCLLLVSADAEVDRVRAERGEAPARDYLELAARLGADVFGAGRLRQGRLVRLLARLLGTGPAIAVCAFPRTGRYDLVFSDSERIGMLLGALLRLRGRRPRHVMLGHHLTPPKKGPFLRLARRGIDHLIVHAEPQRRFAVERLGFDEGQVEVQPYQVDTAFWRPIGVADGEAVIATAGLEFRDYETLIEAVRDMEVEVRIGAASYWSSKANRLARRSVPANVQVRPYAYTELRELYGRSRLIVVPLLDTDFQAGVTTILEAMAMGKAVIVTRSRGQRDVVRGPLWQEAHAAWPAAGPRVSESTGIYVAPGDAGGLRSAIAFLVRRPDVAETLGANGRRLAVESYTVQALGREFARVLNHVASSGLARGGEEGNPPDSSGQFKQSDDLPSPG